MLGIKVKLNKEILTSAGIDGAGNVSVISTVKYFNEDGNITSRAFLDVSGLDITSQQVLNWLSKDLKDGDQIVIEITKDIDVIPPISKKDRDTKEKILKQKMDLFLKMKDELEKAGLI